MLSVFVLFCLSVSLAYGANLLTEPSFEDWPEHWVRGGTHAGSTQWDSRWIDRDDGHTGPGFILAVKHSEIEPHDDTTPCDVYMFQDVAHSLEGECAASIWLKIGGTGSKWDGRGGADQWVQIVVYLWGDEDRTDLLRVVKSAKLEAPVAEWRKLSVRFTAPDSKVKSASFYVYARLVDRYPAAWVAWDDAYLGPAEAAAEEGGAEVNLISGGNFELTDSEFASAFTIEGDPANVSLDSGIKRDGGASARIICPAITSAYLKQIVPLDCGSGPRRVRVSVDCLAKDVVRGERVWYGARMIVWLLDSEGEVCKKAGTYVYDIIPYITGTRDWSTFERTLIIPRGVEKLSVQIGLDHASGTAWFDNARVVEVFHDYLVEEDDQVRVDVDLGNPTSTVLEGLGWNWETVTPARHYASELAMWPDLFERMAWDGPELLRVPVSPGMCPPREYVRGSDSGGPYTYNFDTPPIKNLCRLLEFCTSHDIHVLLANWHAGTNPYRGVENSLWLQKAFYERTADKNPDWMLPYSRERMAEYISELAHYFRVTKGFSCVKYVSVWNEPGYWIDVGQYPDGILEVYSLLDARLREKGIRDQVELVGLEMVEGGESVQRTVDILRDAAYIDVASVHDYGAGLAVATATTPSCPLDESVAAVAPSVRQLESMRADRVPLIMGETNGFGTTPIYGEREQYLACLATVEYAIELLKVGFDGVLKWQYNQPGWIQFSPFRLEDYRACPNRANYYAWAMVHRWTVRNSQVIHTDIEGGLDAARKKRVRAVTLKSPGGRLSVIVTNDGRLPKAATIKPSVPAEGVWHHYYYDGALPEGMQQGAVDVHDDGAVRATLPPESVNVFTTFEQGLTGDAPR